MFLQSTLIGQMYLKVLEVTFNPLMGNIYREDQLIFLRTMLYLFDSIEIKAFRHLKIELTPNDSRNALKHF